MRVVTVIRVAHARRLEQAIGRLAELFHCHSRAECTQALKVHQPEVLMIDPGLLSHDEIDTFVTEARQTSAVVVYYFPLSLSSVASLLPLIAEKRAQVIVADLDDTPSHVREVLANLPHRTVNADVLVAVARSLMRLPPAMSAAVVAVLFDPMAPTKALPVRLGVSRRTIDRALERANCATLHKWSTIAKVARGYDVLRRADSSTGAAVRASGYRHLRSLQHATTTVLGVPSIEALKNLAPASFMSKASKALAAS